MNTLMFLGILVGVYALYMMVDGIIAYRMHSQDGCGCESHQYGRRAQPDMHLMPPFDLMDDDLSRPFRRSRHNLEYFDTMSEKPSTDNPSTIKTMMTNSTTPPPTHPEMMKTMMMNTAEAAAAQPAVVQIVNGIKDVASQVATTCAGVACAVLPEHLVPTVVAEVAKGAQTTVTSELALSKPVKTVTGSFAPTLPSCTGTAIPLKSSDYILGDGTFFNCQADSIGTSAMSSSDSVGIGATGDESMDAYINKVWSETM